MDRSQALKYCECMSDHDWSTRASDMCIVWSRACEFGNI